MRIDLPPPIALAAATAAFVASPPPVVDASFLGAPPRTIVPSRRSIAVPPPLLGASSAVEDVDLDALTVPRLRDMVRDLNPPRGVMSGLRRKGDLIDYLLSRGGGGGGAPVPPPPASSSASASASSAPDAAGKGAAPSPSPSPPRVRRDGSVEWRTERGSSTFGLALDDVPEYSEEEDDAPFDGIAHTFPGALTNAELMDTVASALEGAGYDAESTLVATSLCCDEVNRPLESHLSASFGTTFNMGGLAGFPFGGSTSFGAMAAHIPDGGSCLIVYGPHVGVDSTGDVGTVERRGRAVGGACCGSAVAAAAYVGGVNRGEEYEVEPPDDPIDAQQAYVGSMLLPYADRLDDADDPMRELPRALYDAQTELMGRIIGASGGAVAGDGKIAVLGGIQINTPPGYSDYYLPLRFDLYDGDGELIEDIMPESVVRPFPKVQRVFPGALTNSELVVRVAESLQDAGYDRDKTLVATSLCCDEVNRPLESRLSSAFGYNFNMGGLAGFPFGGSTSFGAMAAHIPDGGSCLIVYGPHVGVDSTGAAGTVERRGRKAGGACCGSAVAAAGYVRGVLGGEAERASPPPDPIDAQQYFVGSMLLPYGGRLAEAPDAMVELPHALYDAQTELMGRILSKSGGAVGEDGTVAVLGGIQINTPPGYEDYYLPLSFDMYGSDGELIERIWE